MSFGACLGILIKIKRGEEQLSQLELAEKAFGNRDQQGWISRLESGLISNPSSRKIQDLRTILTRITDEDIAACHKNVSKENMSRSNKSLPDKKSLYTPNILVKRIIMDSDPLVPDLLGIYHDSFPDEIDSNYKFEDMIEVMNKRFPTKHHIETENITLCVIIDNVVAGILLSHHYPARRKSIISYIAVARIFSKVSNQTEILHRLIVELRRILAGRTDFLVFDLQHYDQREISRCRARLRIFARQATSLRLYLSELPIGYKCPKVKLGDDYSECDGRIFIVHEQKISGNLAKAFIMDVLEFVHMDCYGDMYSLADPLFAPFQGYLRDVVAGYSSRLPDLVVPSLINGATGDPC